MHFTSKVLLTLLLVAPPPSRDALVDHDTIVYPEREFELPFELPRQGRRTIKSLYLHVSYDDGKSWKIHSTVKPDKKGSFLFTSPKDGLYLFKIQTVMKDGTVYPSDLRNAPILQRVLVRTGARVAANDLAAVNATLDRLEHDLQRSGVREASPEARAELKKRLKKIQKKLKQMDKD